MCVGQRHAAKARALAITSNRVFHVKHALRARDVMIATGSHPADMDRLAVILDLLAHWQRRINLVGPRELDDPWRRHILDSAQLVPFLPPGPITVADLGSGAGFPGLVVSILGHTPVHLVESDSRKCAFLREVARETKCEVTIHNTRIESLPSLNAAVIMARACAPLPRLLGYTARHLAENGQALFLKGGGLVSELTDAFKTWNMTEERFPSVSHPEGFVVRISQLRAKAVRTTST